MLTFKDNKRILVIAAMLIYTLTAIYSNGYFAPDEHYQIFEFASYKSGHTKVSQLPWEFGVHIRSTFQPWIAYFVIQLFSNPYTIAFILRLLTAALAIISITRFINTNLYQVETRFRNMYLFLSYFLWFLPFLNVRFSSETWAGLLSLLALSYIRTNQKTSYRHALIIGLLSGLSFLCRFQCAIMFVSLLGWCLIVNKENFKMIAYAIMGFTTVLVAGILLDKLFYGTWTITCWNYLNVNILQDAASVFGLKSWYTYLIEVVLTAILPIGILIVLSLLILFNTNRKSILVWYILPLLIVHLSIPHKEVRFLFPLANVVPLLLIVSMQEFKEILSQYKKLLQPLMALLLIVNGMALYVAIFITPSDGRISITKYVFDHYRKVPTKIYTLSASEENPFRPFSFIRQSFYEMPNVKSKSIDSFSVLSNDLFNKDSLGLLIIKRRDLEDSTLVNKIRKLHLIQLKRGNLRWVAKLEYLYYREAEGTEYLLYGKTK
jgi:phosphatidylinositol glycan class B